MRREIDEDDHLYECGWWYLQNSTKGPTLIWMVVKIERIYITPAFSWSRSTWWPRRTAPRKELSSTPSSCGDYVWSILASCVVVAILFLELTIRCFGFAMIGRCVEFGCYRMLFLRFGLVGRGNISEGWTRSMSFRCRMICVCLDDWIFMVIAIVL